MPTLLRTSALCALASSLLSVGVAHADPVDDRGATAAQGPATWLRAAVHMAPRVAFRHGRIVRVDPLKFEVGHVLDPQGPQSPFSAPFTSSKLVAYTLGLSQPTVSRRLRDALMKLGMRDVADLIRAWDVLGPGHGAP